MLTFQFAPKTNGETNDGMFVAFNNTKSPTEVELPAGKWTIYIQDDKAGTTALGTAEGTITVSPISTTVLVLEESAAAQNGDNPGIWPIIAIAAGVLVIGAAAAAIVIFKKKKQD